MHAAANCRRYVDPFPSACLSCLSLNLYCVRTRDHTKVFTHKHIHTRQQGRDAGCGGRLSQQPTRGQARAVKGAPIRHLKWSKCR